MHTIGVFIGAEELRGNWLAGFVDDLDVGCGSGKLDFDFLYFGTRPGKRIEDDDGSSRAAGSNVSRDFVERVIENRAACAADVFEIAFCVEIVHSDAGARKNVVEVVEE